jgi:cell fate regulator YaaT (PSP1 superfamily)
MQSKIVAIRFSPVGKLYHFDASAIEEIKGGDFVVVETSRGWQLGQVIELVKDPKPVSDGSGWKSVDRKATPRDLVLRMTWQSKEADALQHAYRRAVDLHLTGIKIVNAEYAFDGSRLTFYFNSESEERVELKGLRQDLQRYFSPAQVDLRQIGPRDVAKMIHGMGACGLEKRCCAKFLTEFSSISIRMAKEQGISLTPTEITGMCGRLRCCLIYEYDQYVEMRKCLPRKNSTVTTPHGDGRVVEIYPIRDRVTVELPDGVYREYRREELSGYQTAPQSVPSVEQESDESNASKADA